MKTFNKQLIGLNDEQKEYFINMLHDMMELEQDLAYYKLLTNGTWNNADEIIRSIRIKYKQNHPEEFI